MARMIDANGSYTLNDCNDTGHSLCFGGGFIDVYDPKGKHICQFWAGDAPTVEVVRDMWIPVTERLPEEPDRYLCNVKSFAFPGSFYQAILRYDKYGFREGNIYTDDVTHWMPLPAEPKEG